MITHAEAAVSCSFDEFSIEIFTDRWITLNDDMSNFPIKGRLGESHDLAGQ